MSYVASALFTLNVLSLSMQGGYVFASVSLSICLFVCLFIGRITREVFDPFSCNLVGLCTTVKWRTN